MRALLVAGLLLLSGCIVARQSGESPGPSPAGDEDTPMRTLTLTYPTDPWGATSDPPGSPTKNATVFAVLVTVRAHLDVEGEGGSHLWGEHCGRASWAPDRSKVEYYHGEVDGPAEVSPGVLILDPEQGDWDGYQSSMGSGAGLDTFDPRTETATIRSIFGMTDDDRRPLVHLEFRPHDPSAPTAGDPGSLQHLEFETDWEDKGVEHHGREEVTVENLGVIAGTARSPFMCM